MLIDELGAKSKPVHINECGISKLNTHTHTANAAHPTNVQQQQQHFHTFDNIDNANKNISLGLIQMMARTTRANTLHPIQHT